MWSMVTFAVAIMITCFHVHAFVSWMDFDTKKSDSDEDLPVNGNPAVGLGRNNMHTTSWQGAKSWVQRAAKRRNARDANENIQMMPMA